MRLGEGFGEALGRLWEALGGVGKALGSLCKALGGSGKALGGSRESAGAERNDAPLYIKKIKLPINRGATAYKYSLREFPLSSRSHWRRDINHVPTFFNLFNFLNLFT